MTDNMQLNEFELADAADMVQNFMAGIAPGPGDGLGIAAMLMTNFLSAGVACGLIDQEFIDTFLGNIREAVNQSVAAIHAGIAAEAATETIQ